MKKTVNKALSVYDIITDKFITELEKGVVPWRKPWRGAGWPVNGQTGHEYSGSNLFLLSVAPYSCNRWVTYKQAVALGGNVRCGEKGWPIVFWKFLEKETPAGEKKQLPLLRYYTVFNLEQCENIANTGGTESGADIQPIESADNFLTAAKGFIPEVKHAEGRAFYSPKLDYINVPAASMFDSAEEYYGTLFHEIVHSTGHESRLNREGVGHGQQSFGSGVYSREELVAEIGAAFCCHETGILPAVIDNSIAYVGNWLKQLKNDKTLILWASTRAFNAFRYIRDGVEGVKESGVTNG